MKKGAVIGVFVVIVVLAVGGYFLYSGDDSESAVRNDQPADAQPSATASALSGCVGSISDAILPSSVGGYSGVVVDITKPYSWTGPDNEKVSMPINSGKLNIYTSGTKSVNAAIVDLKSTSDYNKLVADIGITQSQDEVGSISEIDVKGATGYLFDIGPGSQIVFIPIGDNIFSQFGFGGTTASEARSWMSSWAGSVC